jgi:sec-independent protein translocase protein TatB
MLDIGFFELLVVAVVLIIVMGPERLPEVAKQAAFYIRKARQGMFRLRSEMQNEMEGTPFADLQQAKQEMADFKNDMKQFGRDLADSAEQKIDADEAKASQPEPNESKPDNLKSADAESIVEAASASKKISAHKKSSSTVASKSD